MLTATLFFVGAISFGLGRLSVDTQALNKALLCAPPAAFTTTAETQTSAVVLHNETHPAAEGTAPYVASKTGSVYHFPWCAGAKRIKEENKVWFGSKTEAEAAGYRPATNCKGL